MSDTQFDTDHPDLEDSQFGALDGIASIARGVAWGAIAAAAVCAIAALVGYLTTSPDVQLIAGGVAAVMA
jgi:hypothetical protein